MLNETATAPLALPATQTASFSIPRRPLKLAIATTLVLAGAYGIFSESEFVSTSNAVVSAYVLTVRAPIEGDVTGLPLAAGSFIRQGESLGHLENSRVDNQHLDNLRNVEYVAQSTADALAAEQSLLTRQREALVARSDAHAAAITGRLQRQAAEAGRVLESRQLALQQATIELERARQLHSSGILATAEFDRIVSTQRIAGEEVNAQQEELAAIRSEVVAASQGMLTEPGTNNDVSYSRQRADELSIKLAENTRTLVASRAQSHDAHLSVASESSRATLMHTTDLQSPITGMLWKLSAINGERTAAGDAIASLIDCNRQFVLAEVPQERLPDIALHETARVRLSGESFERTGTVISASGDTQHSLDPKLAAVPLHDPNELFAIVLISFDASSAAGQRSEPSCSVGRTARVLIPTTGSNLASRWLRRAF